MSPVAGTRRLWLVPAVAFCVTAALSYPAVFGVFSANNKAGQGHRLFVEGEAEESIGYFGNALEAIPWSTDAAISYARALVETGRPEQALVVIDDAEKWAASQWFWALEAQALAQLGFPEQARRVIDEGLRVLPRSPVLLEAQHELPP